MKIFCQGSAFEVEPGMLALDAASTEWYENGIYTALDVERIRKEMEPILNRLFRA